MRRSRFIAAVVSVALGSAFVSCGNDVMPNDADDDGVSNDAATGDSNLPDASVDGAILDGSRHLDATLDADGTVDGGPNDGATLDADEDAADAADAADGDTDAGICFAVAEMPDASAGSAIVFPYAPITVTSLLTAVAIGDVNNDGRNDLVVATEGGSPALTSLMVFLQTPCGGLAPPKIYAEASTVQHHESVTIADVTGDGLNDVVTDGTSDVEVFPQMADGTLGATQSYSLPGNVQAIAVGDFNNDGRNDVFAVPTAVSGYLLLQKSDGTLGPETTIAVEHEAFQDVRPGDFNHDGLTDVVVMSGENFVPDLEVLLQQSDGGFAAPVPYADPDASIYLTADSIAVGDITGDGRDDIVMSTRSGATTYALFQNATGTLNPPTPFDLNTFVSLSIGDINGDGRNDVAGLSGGVTILLQTDAGPFLDAGTYPVSKFVNPEPRTLAVGDINSDGKRDVVALTGSGIAVYYNAR